MSLSYKENLHRPKLTMPQKAIDADVKGYFSELHNKLDNQPSYECVLSTLDEKISRISQQLGQQSDKIDQQSEQLNKPSSDSELLFNLINKVDGISLRIDALYQLYQNTSKCIDTISQKLSEFDVEGDASEADIAEQDAKEEVPKDWISDEEFNQDSVTDGD